MRRRLERLLARLGAAGVLGVGVLLACAGFYVNALAPEEAQVAAQRLAIERLHQRKLAQPVSMNPREEELRRFYALFPSAGELTNNVERLHRLARSSGLNLDQGEYRLERPAAGGLWAYRITLPVRGGYRQLRAFLSAVLEDMPVVSIDALRFQRKSADDTQIEAQVRLTMHARPMGDLQ